MNGEISLISVPDRRRSRFRPRKKGEIELDAYCGVVMACTGYKQSCGECAVSTRSSVHPSTRSLAGVGAWDEPFRP